VPSEPHIIPSKRSYNQWVANETLEDFALRFTARRARKWSDARVANTALGIVAFLALEAIGGAITLQYGFTNSLWAILVVCGLIFLFGLPVCYHAAKSGLDIDLLTRGAGFGYIGSTVSSLIYASFTFIFFALEAAIMSMALQLLLGIPLAWAYVISALVVIPLVTHGISRISRFQLWTQPIWIILQVAPLVFILLHHADAITQWTQFTGARESDAGGFNLLLFGAAAAVIFPLMAQNGEQVDFLRFLPTEEENSGKWWLALVLAGPGWSVFGLLKLLAGSFLAVLALQHGIAPDLADDPSHMYLVAFSYIMHNPDLALVLAGVFVIISQLKINVTNAYAGSLAWSNFFSRVTHSHPGRIVWLFFNVAIALLLMELGLYQAFESILITYSTLVLAWMGSLVADLVINRGLGLRPKDIEFKRGHLYDINPVGVFSMIIASGLGIASQMGLFGTTLAALAPFVALFIPFLTAPAIAELTGGRYYLVRTDPSAHGSGDCQCTICENSFEQEDMSHCPAYGGRICSLCCALDANCEDRCRPDAHLQAQVNSLIHRYFPDSWVTNLHSSLGHFLSISLFTSLLVAGLFALVYLSMDYPEAAVVEAVGNALVKTFFLLVIVTGVLVWLYVLAQDSRRKALAESRQQTELLRREVSAHEKTARELQAAKEAAVTANQAKSRYLSGVSHELRTPLNTVLGYAQLLESDSELPRKNQQAATAIRRNGEHLADVIEGLLEISKIEARRLDLQRGQVNLRGLLEQLVEVFSVQARARNLTFEYLPAKEMPEFVMADEKRLRQVLTNLLSNAVKFTREGGVTLECSYRNQVARFVVSDTGIGIRSEDQQRIFAPFERIHNEQTRFIGGTGLGLAITRLLCNLMGGDIELQSEFGQGTRFTLRVMLPALRDVPAVAAEPRGITGYLGRRRTLLVVDDQASHRGLIRDFLVPLGFNVLEAHSAEFCLQLLGESDVDGFLLDVSMPLTDGWALVRQLRARGVESPVVMISGNAVEAHGSDLEQRLHDAYLVKPIRLHDLLETLGNLLQLQWTQAAEVEEVSPATAAGKWVPSHEQLQELVAMARIGYLSGVQEKLDVLESAAPDSGFLRELRKRADLCDFDGLIQIMKGVDSGA
jgi:signal transduction histidine kinase/purine-cytosine permease-like protein/FixJ family two-component response regulator